MGRSGLDEWDGDDILAYGRSQGAWRSAVRGKRGQRFFRDLLAALDAMPVKRLVPDELVTKDGEVCLLGALGKARRIEGIEKIDPEAHEELAKAFDVCERVIQYVEYENDEYAATPEDRWVEMRRWAEAQIVKPAPA